MFISHVAEISSVIPVLFRMHLFTSRYLTYLLSPSTSISISLALSLSPANINNTSRTKSYLKTAVQEILVAFFRFSSKAVSILKDLILPKKAGMQSESESGQVLSFSPGSSGGNLPYSHSLTDSLTHNNRSRRSHHGYASERFPRRSDSPGYSTEGDEE